MKGRDKEYLEAIYVLERESKIARVRDIAEYLGIAKSSVSVALKSLVRKGLVEHDRYSYVSLTPRGREMAESVHKASRQLSRFFLRLGLDSPSADEVAECICYNVSDNVLRRLLEVTDVANSD